MAKAISRGKKRFTIALAGVFVVAAAGVAFAYWTSTGTGEGTATTGTSSAFEVTSAAAVGTIAPDNAGQTIAFTVSNPTADPQYLTAVTVEMADENGVAWVPASGCNAADYQAVISTDAPVGEIAAGESVTGVATVTLVNTGENQDACKGQEVPLYFTAS